MNRRHYLGIIGGATISNLSGCMSISDVFPEPQNRKNIKQSSSSYIKGEIKSKEKPILDNAKIEALIEENQVLSNQKVDGRGNFEIKTSRPVWLKASKDGYTTRILPAMPGEHYKINLSRSKNNINLTFGGDIMFGRRFYNDNPDPLDPRFQIKQNKLLESHRKILSYIEPVLQNADITSINLETPLTTSKWRHPTKLYRYISHPIAGQALAESGIDYVTLGNNHILDALKPGLKETINTLDSNNISYSGAGFSSEEAWKPVYKDIRGISIAFISCTTIVGDQYEIDWSADRSQGRSFSVKQGKKSITFPDNIGVAEATKSKLKKYINIANRKADIVVVQIHGGRPYKHKPTEEIYNLVEAASSFGADLIVNHHPHVVGGLEKINSTFVAWSLGNLVFDQKLWSTFPTYLLNVEISKRGIQNIYTNPVIIDGFIPKGVVGKPNKYINLKTIQYSTKQFKIEKTSVTNKRNQNNTKEKTLTFEGNKDIYQRINGRISSIDTVEGEIKLGRDLLPTGVFESLDIDETGYDGLLWRFSRETKRIDQGFGYKNSGGVRMKRIIGNTSPSILSNNARIPVSNPSTLTFLYKSNTDKKLELMVKWYNNTEGEEIKSESWNLPNTQNKWKRIRKKLTPKTNNSYLNFFIRLHPSNAERKVYIDNIRLISWIKDGLPITESRSIDHIVIDGKTTLNIKSLNNQEINWMKLSP